MERERVTDYQVIIIGSGPAGCTAALYLSRANIKAIVLEGLQPGGQLTITTDVENYPGFPEGILGPKLMDLMRQQAERFGAVFRALEPVENVNFRTHPFEVQTDQRLYVAPAVIVASGASAKQIGLPSEQALQGFGVSYCATCDGFFFKNKEIVVVGGGDSAMEEATFLTKFASKVTVIHRREELRASKIMQERALSNSKIEFVFNTTVDEVIGTKENGVTSLKLRNLNTNEVTDFATQGLFVAIGHTPNTAPYVGQLELDQAGYICLPHRHSTVTNIQGVFACGDVVDHIYRQAITAAGSGCQAALDCERWLTHQRITERWGLAQGEEERVDT
ncbi:MAG: thioredoxin-disulfide reductase [Acidobacteria bacterium]|nr:thioredoxin-disulfide reductase [Acidobacteriota bacterium]MBV9476531.1 thioredoxin-disulfide reductase [Acidobacteriota bacterium]